VIITGEDEVGHLASNFNEMALRLQSADQKQHELDHLRKDLIAWVSHDLQTPLASIRAVIEALADGMVDDPETIQRYLRSTQHDIRSLSVMIDDLFQMAQIDAGGMSLNREWCSLTDLVSDTLESFSELAARQAVILEGRVAPGLDPVYMDLPRIGRVLNNLIGNALRHTPAGGKVQVVAQSSDRLVSVQVSDTGEGIPAADLPYIFDRFYRGDKSRNRSTGGAGLGLAIARGIVEAHGGTISTLSQPTLGTQFTFTLPKTS
jgi:signal transduction histidine kinase